MTYHGKTKEELIAEIERLRGLVFAPGEMRCAKCKFSLVRNNLCANTGRVSAGSSETEPCPNGCGPLWPRTWKEIAYENGEELDQAFDNGFSAGKRALEDQPQ